MQVRGNLADAPVIRVLVCKVPIHYVEWTKDRITLSRNEIRLREKKWSCEQRGKYDNQGSGKKSSNSTLPEVQYAEGSTFKFATYLSKNQETTDYEEYIDANEPTMESQKICMVKNHR